MAHDSTDANRIDAKSRSAACPACGGTCDSQHVSVTFWIGALLQMIENVPARVCTSCGARHYDDETEQRVSALIAAGAPEWKAKRVVSVPVFDYAEIDSVAAGLLAPPDAGARPLADTPRQERSDGDHAATDATVASASEENLRY